MNHDIVLSLSFLPVLKRLDNVVCHIVKALCVQKVVMTHKTFVDKILTFQPTIHHLGCNA